MGAGISIAFLNGVDMILNWTYLVLGGWTFIWAWVIFTILNVNPASWIINWVYLKNRWQEMKSIVTFNN